MKRATAVYKIKINKNKVILITKGKLKANKKSNMKLLFLYM
ncbi:Hypothetical cytosolic protein [Lactobacillus helveticus H10]|jgi:hypothetical protein|nr:Hypothetical cytosolic protein [Lactobacillus helveticus H10]